MGTHGYKGLEHAIFGSVAEKMVKKSPVPVLTITYIIARLKISIDNHKQLARTDHLTGIANRRAFFDSANLELNKARRNHTSISVLYMDIDNFKHIFEIIPATVDEMIDVADAQMYLAKQNGKNRTRYKVIKDDENIVRSEVNL